MKSRSSRFLFILIRLNLICFLVITLSGFTGLLPTVYGAVVEKNPPILRHSPPGPKNIGREMVIRTVVEDESEVKSVKLMYRATGKKGFNELPMRKVSNKMFEGKISISKEFEHGIEYFIVATDQYGNRGKDGMEFKPYFVEIRHFSNIPPLVSGPREDKKTTKRPFWKSKWFWIGIGAVAAGGGVLAFTGGGDNNEEGSGTVTVR